MTAPASSSDFPAALPDRPITVRPPQTLGPMSASGIFIMLFGLLAGALWWLGPDLATDWRIRGDVAPARDASIEEARCHSRLAVFTVCDVTFTDTSRGPAAKRSLWYFFIDTADQDRLVLVRGLSDPAAVSTLLGQDKFYRRLLALALIVGLVGFCIVVSAQMVRDGLVTRRALLALSGQRLRPVLVGVEGKVIIAHKRRRWTYVYEAGGRQERACIEMASRDDPLFTSPDGRTAVAVAGEAGGVPLLLDQRLSALDMTEAEKEAFFASCREVLAQRGSL